MKGRHECSKPKTDSTFSAQWSGVTFAPECRYSKCPKCGGHTHHEGGSHYCPKCDDYVRKTDERCKYN